LIDIRQKLSSDITGYFSYLGKDLQKYTKEVQGREFFMYAIVEINRIWKSINTKTYDEEYSRHEIDEIYDAPDGYKEDKIDTIKSDNMIQFTNTYYKITFALPSLFST
jgi:hypothetical protein